MELRRRESRKDGSEVRKEGRVRKDGRKEGWMEGKMEGRESRENKSKKDINQMEKADQIIYIQHYIPSRNVICKWWF